ncbi:hypothetical protein RvY_11737-2 [Ramazzottius varieornatus]|uniref:Uncharacterized protein n=1 Tax=Ramazzottius varieornatus TaxID=947166 RepID=A0A1D1VH24_RAMVA|nr:hypothetical protein RvY_11737-2 [Ramazzottius varieornatus]
MELSSLLLKARQNQKKAVYPWLRTVYGNPEKMLSQLNARRDQLLDDIPSTPFDIPDDMIVEWLTLMAERDVVVHEIFIKRRKEAFDEATRALHQALLDHRRLQPNRPVDHAFPAINAALNEVQDYLLNYGSFETTKPAKGTSIVKKEFFSVEVQTENIPDEPAPIQKLILDLGTQTDLDSQPAEIIKQYSDWHCQMELIKLRTEAEVQTDNNFDDLIAEERSFLSHSPVFEAKWKPEASSTPLGKKPQSFSRVTVLTQKQPDAILGGSERGEALIAETDALTGNVEILATTYEKLVQNWKCPRDLAAYPRTACR